jgi:hypothetical protein
MNKNIKNKPQKQYRNIRVPVELADKIKGIANKEERTIEKVTSRFLSSQIRLYDFSR